MADDEKPPADYRDWMGIEETFLPDPNGEIIINGTPHKRVKRQVVGKGGKRFPLD